jgi:sugar lactone lactonase YvrE
LPAPTATMIAEIGGMSTPESVRYDAELNVWFVSNIVGIPSQKDGKAFIARIHADSANRMTKLVEGGVKGATLHAPKGMAIVGDTLWVADIDMLRGFNRRTGDTVAVISLQAQDATFLNDVVATPDGTIYITDTGIAFDSAGVMTHPGVDRIFRVNRRVVQELARSNPLARPNGIAWDATNNRLILAPFGSTDLQALTVGVAEPVAIATGPGSYDGLEIMSDGRFLVSSWADSAVHIVNNGTMSKLVTGIAAPADIGLDPKNNIIAIPRFNDGKVVFFRIQ